MKIDLTNYFTRVGKLYVNWLSQSIKRQQNYDNSGGYVPKKYNVSIPVRHKKTGKTTPRNVGNKRLYVSGNFAQNAFIFETTADSLTLKGNDSTHSQGTAYADIIAYNDADSPYLKGKRGSTIKGLATKLFPWTEVAFIKVYKLITGKEMVDDLTAEIKLQVEAELAKEITHKIELIL